MACQGFTDLAALPMVEDEEEGERQAPEFPRDFSPETGELADFLDRFRLRRRELVPAHPFGGHRKSRVLRPGMQDGRTR